MVKNFKMNIKKHINNIQNNGISIIPNLITQKDCKSFKKKINSAYK